MGTFTLNSFSIGKEPPLLKIFILLALAFKTTPFLLRFNTIRQAQGFGMNTLIALLAFPLLQEQPIKFWATPTTGAVALSLIGPYTPATYTAHGVLLGEGTGSIVATAVGATGQTLMGNTGADPTWTGSPSFSGTVTAGTGFTATTGNLTLSGTGSGLVTTPTVVAAAASPQTANGRIVDVTFSSVSIAAGATQSFVINNSAVPASTSSYQLSMVGATAGAALSIVSVTNVAATSTTIVITNGTGATTSIANIRFTMTFLN